MWAEDLKYHFPFLDEKCNRHPYQLHYYIWKLSYLFGATYCDNSIQFEKLVDNPGAEIARLFRSVDAELVDAQALKAVVVSPPLEAARYADDAWFEEHEANCEAVLAELGQGERSQAGDLLARRPAESGHSMILSHSSPGRLVRGLSSHSTQG